MSSASSPALPLRAMASAAVSTSSSDPGGIAGFFRYHGAWAPGVRLFRSIGFKSKAAIIALTFVLPLATLAWQYFNSQADLIAFSAKERLGVTYAQELMPLLGLLERSQTGSATEVGAAIDAQAAKLAALQARDGEALGTATSHAELAKAMAAVRSGAAGAPARAKQALLDLVAVATDGSNLTLDPDIDSYYLMDAAMFRLPAMIDAADQLRATGKAVAAAAAATPAQVRLVTEKWTQLRDNQLAVDAGLAKSVAYNAAVAKTVPGGGAAAAVQSLLEAVNAGVLDAAGARVDAASAAALDAASSRAAAALFKLAADASAQLDALIAERVAKLEAGRNFTAVVLLIGLALSLYLFMAFGKVLSGGLKEVAFHIDAMRDGNLTTRPRAWGNDEAAGLMHTLVQMQTALRRIVSQVRGGSDQIVGASAEIASGAGDLSARTEQSAANLEQTAAAMEQISVTVQRNVETVHEANQLASSNAQAAERGGRIIGEVAQTMERINGASSRIGDIIGTIEGIAFQTNILALNAAVEAARAGEQGRGFAVVASEVRALAQRSSTAAKEIKGLISDSIQQVEGGVRVVRQAGTTIGELVETSKRMSGLLDEVSTGAREQSAGVSQSARAVQELDKVTQQNAALVEQTAAAASVLRDRARALAGEVSQFKLPG